MVCRFFIDASTALFRNAPLQSAKVGSRTPRPIVSSSLHTGSQEAMLESGLFPSAGQTISGINFDQTAEGYRGQRDPSIGVSLPKTEFSPA
jgi:hypothetical protein